MNELLKKQTCPYCECEKEEHEAVYDESGNKVICDECEGEYISKPQYILEGWIIEKKCSKCGEWTDDGYEMCDCERK